MWPGGTPGTLGETKVGGTLPVLARTAAVSATRDMATATAATVEPAATRSICPTSTRASSGGTWLSMATSAISDRTLPEEWERLPISGVGVRRDGDDLEAAGLGLEGHLDRRRVEAAVGEDEHGVALLEGIALEEDLGVALLALEPEELPGPARADDVRPHQPRDRRAGRSRRSSRSGGRCRGPG